MTADNNSASRNALRWPSPAELERMGFVRCPESKCSAWVDPINVPEGRCREHSHRGRPSRIGPHR